MLFPFKYSKEVQYCKMASGVIPVWVTIIPLWERKTVQ